MRISNNKKVNVVVLMGTCQPVGGGPPHFRKDGEMEEIFGSVYSAKG